MNVQELTKLIELKKRKAELEFKKSVLGLACEEELNEILSSASGLERKVRAAGIRIVFPKQNKLDELGSKLGDFPPERIKEEIQKRSGEIYEILIERGVLIKENFENRLEIAKLFLIIARAGREEREALTNTIAVGVINEPLTVETLRIEDKQKLVKFLRRCRILCLLSENKLLPTEENEEKEVYMEVLNRSVWVSQEKKEKLEKNLNRIKEITPDIQLKNAQRHVKIFSEEEEDHFAALQKEYLELLKEQDELLHEYDEEGKLSVRA